MLVVQLLRPPLQQRHTIKSTAKRLKAPSFVPTCVTRNSNSVANIETSDNTEWRPAANIRTQNIRQTVPNDTPKA
jgi:hypothetical protein